MVSTSQKDLGELISCIRDFFSKYKKLALLKHLQSKFTRLAELSFS